ncbi:hypothetical protein FM103_20255 [Corynebacterium xerosis]|nr:hypothetical protein FM103_20255 [Corynebacterium xerosis]
MAGDHGPGSPEGDGVRRLAHCGRAGRSPSMDLRRGSGGVRAV